MSDLMMISVRAGFHNLFTIPVARRLPHSSIPVLACLLLAPLICADTVCGQEAAEGLRAMVTRPIHPVLIRNEHGPLLRVVVEVDEGVEAQASSLIFKLDGTDDMGDLESLTLYDTGDSEAFSPTTRVGEPAMPGAEITFRLERPLRAGKNVFWLSCRLKATAALHHGIAAACPSIATTAGKVVPRDTFVDGATSYRRRVAKAQRRRRSHLSYSGADNVG